MFLTVTINTTRQKKSGLKFRKRKFKARDGWRKSLNMKKRNLWQRMRSWVRATRVKSHKHYYRPAMY